MTVAGHKSYFKLTPDTPYLALASELWGVCCKNLEKNWPRYNGTALYHVVFDTVINFINPG